MDLAFKIFVYGTIFCFGVCIFSFLNVLIYRIPKKIQFVKGSSFCPTCNHELGVFDLFPILSYIFLGGKCRYCKAKISPRYAFVELLGGVLALAAAIKYFPFSHFFEHIHIHDDMWISIIKAVFAFVLFALLTVVTFIDIDTQEIGNGASIMAAVMGIISIFLLTEVSPLEHIIGFFVISVPMLILVLIIPGAFGGGDIKFMFGIGGLLGWKLALFGFFSGCIVGGVVAVVGMILGKIKRKDHVAFGPFLCIGVIIALLFGRAFLDWYFRGLI
ncbi:MAG: prepilin peptidase [Lachnospiraceae bacterium]|nr:prepilin peptidase [Lachnospiraceae bacterium]